jgi:hypothetical protein
MVSFGAGGTFSIGVQNAAGLSASGWDFLQINDTLNVQATNSAPFTLQLQSFAANGPGEVTNFNANTSYSWTIAVALGGISNFSPNAFGVDTTAFQNDLAGGYFYAGTAQDSLMLSFTNNHAPVVATYWLYQRPNGLAIPIANLASNWSDADGDPLILNDVDTASTNGVSVTFDPRFIYYNGATAVPDALSYSVQDVRTNPPAVYRPGDTQRTAEGAIIVLPPPLIDNVRTVGSDVILSGRGGIPGATYSVLGTTNLALRLNQWQPLGAGNFDSNGNFTFTNAPVADAPQGFYLLKLQD